MFEMIFEWDSKKEQENFEAHGIHFETAARAFFDPFRMERHDDDSSEEEDRWQTMGFLTMCFSWSIQNAETLPA